LAWAQDSSILGEWGALLVAGSAELRLKLVIMEGEGGLKADLYSLDQGDGAIPASTVSFKDNRLEAEFPSIKGKLVVELTSAGSLKGSWIQGATFPVEFVRNPDFQALKPPPLPFTQETLEQLLIESGCPALAAAAHKSQTVLLYAGLRSIKDTVPVQSSDKWHLGSITKSMTATLVAMAVEKGFLKWDSTLEEVFGETIPAMLDAYRKVTVLHLLSHRSGLEANLPVGDFLKFPLEEADARQSRLEYTEESLSRPPAAPMGEAFLYSNSGFIIAGAILETRLQQSWESIITDWLFTPLGLKSAGFGPPPVGEGLESPVGHNLSLGGHLGMGSRRVPFPPRNKRRVDNPAVLGPAGRVHMGLEDLLTYLLIHRDKDKFLSEESWNKLHTPPFGEHYACGLFVRKDGSLWHNGTNTLWYAEILIDREKGVVAAAAANDGALKYASPAVGKALASAAGI
jgi:CubicO group peptidase (beta-lactamase class C family)